MAERRMFAKTIIDSDAFLDMPATTQLLYFHLSMRADDDGFINNPKKIQRVVGCSDDDLKLLMAKQFILAFESGVIVIKHWRIHNYIQKDRYKETVYQEEKAMLGVKENNSYTFRIQSADEMETVCIQDVSNLDTKTIDSVSNLYPMRIQDVSKTDTQVRLVKDSLGEVRIGEDRSSTLTAQDDALSTGDKVRLLIEKYWKRDLVYDDALHYLSKVLTDGAEDSNKMQMLEIALKLSAAHGEKACNWAYVNAIYDGWRERNITTPEEWDAYEQNRKGGAR